MSREQLEAGPQLEGGPQLQLRLLLSASSLLCIPFIPSHYRSDFCPWWGTQPWGHCQSMACVCACGCPQSLSVVSDSATLWTVACQASLSVEFSKQEYWSGLPLPSPGDLPKPGIEATPYSTFEQIRRQRQLHGCIVWWEEASSWIEKGTRFCWMQPYTRAHGLVSKSKRDFAHSTLHLHKVEAGPNDLAWPLISLPTSVLP